MKSVHELGYRILQYRFDMRSVAALKARNYSSSRFWVIVGAIHDHFPVVALAMSVPVSLSDP